jgi:ABC-type phosphate/phosphonate transport system permease subunit
MRVTTKLLSIFIIASFVATPILLADAQPALSLSMTRDWGSSMGNDIAGLFTLKADASSNTSYVEFYLDNQLELNVTAAPYNWQFNTNNCTLGEHTLKAVAYDGAGESKTSEITRNFVEDNTSTILIVTVVIAVVITVVAVVVAVYRIKKSKK